MSKATQQNKEGFEDVLFDEVKELRKRIGNLERGRSTLIHLVKKLKGLIREAVKNFAHRVGKGELAEDKKRVEAIVERIIAEENMISWCTTDERRALELDISIRDDRIKELETALADTGHAPGCLGREGSACTCGKTLLQQIGEDYRAAKTPQCIHKATRPDGGGIDG